MRLPTIIALCLLFLAPLHAQQVATSEQTAAKPEGKSLFGKVSTAFTAPLHPVIKGIVAGGGLGLGLGYDVPTSSRWETSAEAVATYRRYWSAQLETAYRGDHGRVGAYARIREMPQLSYFGSGIQSDVANRRNFLMRDPVVGAVASARLSDWVSAGVRVEELWPDLGPGASSQHPSVEDRFTAIDAPGLNAQPRFGRTRDSPISRHRRASVRDSTRADGTASVTHCSKISSSTGSASLGWTLRVDTSSRCSAPTTGSRFTAGSPRLTRGLAIPCRSTCSPPSAAPARFAASARTSSDPTAAGHASRIRQFPVSRPESAAAPGRLSRPLRGPFDASVFFDAGKVTPRPADLNLSGLKHDYGFSISVMRGGNTALRSDFAFGSGEGTKIVVSFGLIDER